MSFGLIILLIILVFILRPIIRVIWAVHKLKKQARNFMKDAQQAAEPTQERPAGWSMDATKVKRKKITADVGEYVKFQELEQVRVAGERVEFTREEQIVDVKWEELPEKEK